MRHVICRFRDLTELREHLVYSPQTWQPPCAVSFLGSFQAEDNERISMSLECEDTGERCVIEVVVGQGLAHNSDALWHYIGRIEEEDRVWVEMMLAKSQTIAHFVAA